MTWHEKRLKQSYLSVFPSCWPSQQVLTNQKNLQKFGFFEIWKNGNVDFSLSIFGEGQHFGQHKLTFLKDIYIVSLQYDLAPLTWGFGWRGPIYPFFLKNTKIHYLDSPYNLVNKCWLDVDQMLTIKKFII